MPVRYLLDTDTFSYAVSNRYPEVRRHLSSLTTVPVLSSISLAEIMYGVRKKRSKKLESMVGLFTELVEVRDFTASAANEYAKIRNLLEESGQLIGNMDMLIAAVAKAEGLTLVTNNTAHFSRIAKLKIVNWVKR